LRALYAGRGTSKPIYGMNWEAGAGCCGLRRWDDPWQEAVEEAWTVTDRREGLPGFAAAFEEAMLARFWCPRRRRLGVDAWLCRVSEAVCQVRELDSSYLGALASLAHPARPVPWWSSRIGVVDSLTTITAITGMRQCIRRYRSAVKGSHNSHRQWTTVCRCRSQTRLGPSSFPAKPPRYGAT
jgi:hypothetical protein